MCFGKTNGYSPEPEGWFYVPSGINSIYLSSHTVQNISAGVGEHAQQSLCNKTTEMINGQGALLAFSLLFFLPSVSLNTEEQSVVF